MNKLLSALIAAVFATASLSAIAADAPKAPKAEKHAAKKHPEILKLRFDKERSPIDGIPTDMRVPLYSVLLAHAGPFVGTFQFGEFAVIRHDSSVAANLACDDRRRQRFAV